MQKYKRINIPLEYQPCCTEEKILPDMSKQLGIYYKNNKHLNRNQIC